MERFETYRGVAYPWHCDSMGHMNTQFYSALFDGATLHALSAVATSAELARASLGWADVRQLIEYKQEVAAGTLLRVTTEFTRCGTSSITYRHSLLGTETDALHATSEQTTVLFNLSQRKSQPLTPAMRQRIEKLACSST